MSKICPDPSLEHAHLPAAMRPNDPYEVSGIQTGFQLPRWIWRTMFTCYALFFIGIGAATGRDTATIFMILISILYTLMYFTTAALLHRQKGIERPSPLVQSGGFLDTWTGPMDSATVAAQILAVPAGFAFLGIIFFVIRASTGF
ncbi:MAG: hypothetical protein U0S50_01525 [Sphingopyxis sp.]|uniref:hypothetical protein n=1 Tax=Sphingopyxis sp. TaxID=1908224 RepID=UPI002ABC2547|nr:hypothetical protein [Sphingopyxis sp.]MDZ3830481.1 hypothetical protein [Sphingopyxis sp.]